MSGNINPDYEFNYYVVFKNVVTRNLSITGVHIDGSVFRILGMYYQEIPRDVPPQLLDVPNMSKAMESSGRGPSIRPGETLAVIVPLKVTTQARCALIVPKFEVVDASGNAHQVPGIPYYIEGGRESR